MVADCNLLRSKNTELIQQVQQMNERIYQMELALQSWKEEPPKESTTGSLKLEDLMASLQDSQGDIEEAITDAIYHLDSSDLEDFVQVELSLSGNEINTELETTNRYAIERFVRNYISSQVMEKLEMGIAHYFENLTPKADDSI